jgi:hypothetical protein
VRAITHAVAKIDRHVRQPFRHQLTVDDLLLVARYCAVSRRPQLRDVLLEVFLVLLELVVKVDVERRGLAESQFDARGRVAAQ